jgi:hypothetical protein
MDHIVTMNIDDLDDEPCMGPAFDAQLRRLPPGTTFSYSMVPRRIVAIAEETARLAAEAKAIAEELLNKLLEARFKAGEAVRKGEGNAAELTAKLAEVMEETMKAILTAEAGEVLAAEAKARLDAAVKASA